MVRMAVSKSRAQLDQEIADAFASRSDLSPRAVRKLLDPFRGFRRQMRFDVFDAAGRWVGDTWAFNVKDAVGVGGGVAYAIEHARDPSKVTLEELKRALKGSSSSASSPSRPSHSTKRQSRRRSVGHLAWLDGGVKEAYVQDGEVYVAPTSYPIDSEGRRQGARWESSLAHWRRYYDELWKPRVPRVSTRR